MVITLRAGKATTCNSTTVIDEGYVVVCDVPNQVNAKRQREEEEKGREGRSHELILQYIQSTLKEYS